ncbi:hypothetical protein D9M68_767520 [compost metagenome]
MFANQTAQRIERLCLFQVGGDDDLVEHCLAIALKHLHQMVARAAEAVQCRLAHACRLRQFLQCGAGAVDDGYGQGLEKSFVLGGQRHQRISDRFLECAHCAENPCASKDGDGLNHTRIT